MKKPCPICRGHKFAVCPVGDGFDCVFCDSSGEVDGDFVCICGRPGVRIVTDVEHQSKAICLSEDCKTKFEKGGFS